MRANGQFSQDKRGHEGRPRWVLCPGEGRELDVSAKACHPCRVNALRRTKDADKEEWDILDGPSTLPTLEPEPILGDTGTASESGAQQSQLDGLAGLTVPQVRALLRGMQMEYAGSEAALRGRLRMRLDRQARLQVWILEMRTKCIRELPKSLPSPETAELHKPRT
eukprot:SAG31_NODE_888_length_11219_cov_5.584712_3_plen_166_part_00